jgi:hypothetical protein
MKTADADSSSVMLDVEGKAEELLRVGASLRGSVYRGRATGSYFRLIPIRLAPVEWRYEIQQSIQGTVPPGVIPPDRAWQPVDRPGFFCVRYQAPEGFATLAENLLTAQPAQRLRQSAAWLRAAQTWETSLPRPLLPLASDVVIRGGNVQLLWLPPSPPPTVDCVFCEPEVALYLAPELIRAPSGGRWNHPEFAAAISRYALGVSAVAAFYELPAAEDCDVTLFRAAAGTLLKDLPKRSDMPAWLPQFAAGRQAPALARRLVAVAPETRLKDSLATLAEALEQCADRCDPRVAAQELCDFGRPAEALALLQGVFPLADDYRLSEEEMYALLTRAGDIAGQYLSRPLEAIDFYDRAVEKLPDRPEAHEAQFKLIAGASDTPILELILRDDSASVQLDVRAWRGFRGMGAERQPFYAFPMARYLNWRRQFAKAVPFIWERLFEADGKYRWWDFDLNLEYVRALTGSGQLQPADEQLQKVKQGLLYVQANQTFAADEIDFYGMQCAEMERLIHELRNDVTRT